MVRSASRATLARLFRRFTGRDWARAFSRAARWASARINLLVPAEWASASVTVSRTAFPAITRVSLSSSRSRREGGGTKGFRSSSASLASSAFARSSAEKAPRPVVMRNSSASWYRTGTPGGAADPVAGAAWRGVSRKKRRAAARRRILQGLMGGSKRMGWSGGMVLPSVGDGTSQSTRDPLKPSGIRRRQAHGGRFRTSGSAWLRGGWALGSKDRCAGHPRRLRGCSSSGGPPPL